MCAKSQCADYYPQMLGAESVYGGFTISCEALTEVDKDITERELMIKYRGECRPVLHYNYHAWPDHGTPTKTLPLRRLSRCLESLPPQGPPVIHCSAGEQP